jgi:hypothetical protein
MNETEARTLREAHNAYVKRLSRMSRYNLEHAYRADLADRGRQVISGGPVSKDDLIAALCDLHYPVAKLNEATHTLYHTPGATNSACELCHDDDGLHAGYLCECSRHRETDCASCGQMMAFHFSTTYTPGDRPVLTEHGHLGHAYLRPVSA